MNNNNVNNNNNSESFDINDESFSIKTHNKDVYSAIPGAFFDENIFRHLDQDKDLNTRGRQQNFHSVTAFPYDKKTKKIDMNSYSLAPNPPFVYDGSRKVVGFLLNVKKNGAKCIEGAQADLWSSDRNVGTGVGLQPRGIRTVFVKKPARGQSAERFLKEEMNQYKIKKDLVKLTFNRNNLNNNVYQTNERILKAQSVSPLRIREEDNGNTVHVFNDAVYNMAQQKLAREPNMARLRDRQAQRMSGKRDGRMWQPYNEYIFRSNGVDNQMKIEGILLDVRKGNVITDKNRLFDNITNMIRFKENANGRPFRVYKIGNDNRVKHLKNLDEIRNTINNDFLNHH